MYCKRRYYPYGWKSRMNAMIMPGVRLGEGAIVAAGSVVVKDVQSLAAILPRRSRNASPIKKSTC